MLPPRWARLAILHAQIWCKFTHFTMHATHTFDIRLVCTLLAGQTFVFFIRILPSSWTIDTSILSNVNRKHTLATHDTCRVSNTVLVKTFVTCGTRDSFVFSKAFGATFAHKISNGWSVCTWNTLRARIRSSIRLSKAFWTVVAAYFQSLVVTRWTFLAQRFLWNCCKRSNIALGTTGRFGASGVETSRTVFTQIQPLILLKCTYNTIHTRKRRN